jgi:GT2 family glycosyltransferase/LmbE family N-acetylglucosaminyl deacetylase
MNLEHFFIPYTAQNSLPGKTVAVLAPHPDDEVFGCGGALHQLCRQGANIHVAIISSGAAHNAEDLNHAGDRKLESLRAAEILGYPEPEFWGLDDGTLFDETRLHSRIANWLKKIDPDLVLAPSTWEMHRDHRAVATAALQALKSCRDDAQIALYEVGVPLQPNLLIDISAVSEVKMQAMQCFSSQQALQHYSEQIQGLNTYRTYSLPLEVISAEAYLLLNKAQAEKVLTDESPEQQTFVLRAAAMQLEKESQLRLKFEQQVFTLGKDKAKLIDQLDLSLHQKSSLVTQLSIAQKNEMEHYKAAQAGEKNHLKAALQYEENHLKTVQQYEKSNLDSTQKFEVIVQSKESQIQQLNGDMHRLMMSTSWRITAPIRTVKSFLRQPKKIRGYPRRVARKLWHSLPLSSGSRSIIRSVLSSSRKTAERLSYSENNARSARQLLERRTAITRFPYAATSQSIDIPLDISVVTYNSADLLAAFIDSLLLQNYPTALINLTFVDNGSSDNTLTVLEALQKQHQSRFSHIQTIKQQNKGFGAGHNAGINAGTEEFVLVVNPDIEFTADALVHLMADVRQSSDDVACWEARQKPYEHPKLYDPITREVNWCSHACVLLRRSAMEQINGYDERIFLYAEDVEVSYRLRESGFLLKYVPKSVVWHYTYESAGQVKPAQYVGSLIGNFYLRTRYGTVKDRLFILPMLLSLLSHSPFPGARKALVKDFFTRYLRFVPQLLCERNNSAKQAFSFRLLDYEKQREGAFWSGKNLAETPLVSIITRTVANRGELLKQAGFSVFNQTYPNIEWVIVEDGGDSQRPYVEHFSSTQNVQVIYEPLAKVGRSAAGNRGMELASGDWLMFLDDDDCLYADHVETLMLEIQANIGVSAAYSLAWEVESKVEEGGLRIEEASYHQVPSLKQAYDYKLLRHSNYIPIQSILFSAQLFQQRGGFDVTLDYLEDWHLWQRFAHDNTFAYVPKTTSIYRTPMDSKLRKHRQSLLDGAYVEVKEKSEDDIQMIIAAEQQVLRKEM